MAYKQLFFRAEAREQIAGAYNYPCTALGLSFQGSKHHPTDQDNPGRAQ